MEPSPTHVDVADVYKGDEIAGRLIRRQDDVVFTYLDEYLDTDLPAVSTTIPKVRGELMSHGGAVPAFFAGLLPEGRRLVSLQRSLKTSADDEFSQLIAVGRDCIGDVRVLPEGADPSPKTGDEPSISLPVEVSFMDLFEQTLGRGSDDPNPSVPGVQDKLSDSMLSLPARQSGGSVILKLSPARVPRLVENEAFFLGLAQQCGLRTPNFSIVVDKTGASGLAVERFDRALTKGVHTRIAQEDAVQLAGRWPASKYRMSAKEVFDAVLTVTPALPVARAQLLRLFVFSYMIGNGDLHAKNVSVFDMPHGVWSVTPAYDLVSTVPYKDQTMALQFEGRDSNIKGSMFVGFAERLGATEKLVRRIITEVTDQAEPLIEGVDQIGWEGRQTEHLKRTIRERIADLRS